MFTKFNQKLHQELGAVAAVCIVAMAGLALEFGHVGGLRAGSVEVGELQPIHLEQLADSTLPGIVVTATRLPAAQLASSDPATARTAG